jgi:hypothetical protein
MADQLQELMALLTQGANTQRGRFGMPSMGKAIGPSTPGPVSAGGPPPESVAPSAGEEPSGEPGGTSDEDMLENVRRGMGNEGGPPPGSGMKWEDLADDQNALVDDPSPENVQAFVQYWGQENLPEELGGRGNMSRAEPGIGGPKPSSGY